MNKRQLSRSVALCAFAALASSAFAQSNVNNAGGTQNTGGTGQPGTTNSGNPTNMAPGSGSTYRSESDYRSARTACDKAPANSRDTCLRDADANWNRGRDAATATPGSASMGASGTGAMTNSTQGSAMAQTKCAQLEGAKKEECLKSTHAGK